MFRDWRQKRKGIVSSSAQFLRVTKSDIVCDSGVNML
jgi:hypothetical protein